MIYLKKNSVSYPFRYRGRQTPFSDDFRTLGKPLAGVSSIPFAVIIAVVPPVVEQHSPASAAALHSFIHIPIPKRKGPGEGPVGC